MTLREQVLEYFAGLPVTLRAVRHVEEDLYVRGKALAGILNELSEDDDSPLFKTLGAYTGDGEPRKAWYNCYARRR